MALTHPRTADGPPAQSRTETKGRVGGLQHDPRASLRPSRHCHAEFLRLVDLPRCSFRHGVGMSQTSQDIATQALLRWNELRALGVDCRKRLEDPELKKLEQDLRVIRQCMERK